MFIVVPGATLNAGDVSGVTTAQEHKEHLPGQEQSDPCDLVVLEKNHQSDETSPVKEVCEGPNFSSLSSKDKFRVCGEAIKKNGCKIILFGLGVTGAGLAIFSIVDGAVRLDALSQQPNYTQYINSSPKCAIYDGGYFGHLDPACEAVMESRTIATLEMAFGGTMSALVSFAGFGFGAVCHLNR